MEQRRSDATKRHRRRCRGRRSPSSCSSPGVVTAVTTTTTPAPTTRRRVVDRRRRRRRRDTRRPPADALPVRLRHRCVPAGRRGHRAGQGVRRRPEAVHRPGRDRTPPRSSPSAATSSSTSTPPSAPGTVNNFVTLARYGYYDDTTIFRADPGHRHHPGRRQQHTPTRSATRSPTRARRARTRRARSRWPTPAAELRRRAVVRHDGTDAANLDAHGTYAVFGDVTEGLDVAQAIHRSPARRAATRRARPSPSRRVTIAESLSDRQVAADRRTAGRRGRRRRRPAPTPAGADAAPTPVGSSTTGVSASDAACGAALLAPRLDAGDHGHAAAPGRARA